MSLGKMDYEHSFTTHLASQWVLHCHACTASSTMGRMSFRPPWLRDDSSLPREVVYTQHAALSSFAVLPTHCLLPSSLARLHGLACKNELSSIAFLM